jgi:hypothetical protein
MSADDGGAWEQLHIYELGGLFYQVLGHAWDHEVKDFKVVYRPLYHCEAKPGSFPAHTLAVSHFSRWEQKFARVRFDSEAQFCARVPAEVRARILPGPFWHDEAFGAAGAARACGGGSAGDAEPSWQSLPGGQPRRFSPFAHPRRADLVAHAQSTPAAAAVPGTRTHDTEEQAAPAPLA